MILNKFSQLFFQPIIIDLPAAAPPTPAPPVIAPKRPGRKWSIVDTSYYGIRGAGGIRPVKVRDKCTLLCI